MSVCLCGEKPHTSKCPAFEGWDEDPGPLHARISKLEAKLAASEEERTKLLALVEKWREAVALFKAMPEDLRREAASTDVILDAADELSSILSERDTEGQE